MLSRVVNVAATDGNRLTGLLSSHDGLEPGDIDERCTLFLFSGPLSMFGAKVQIALLEKGPRVRALMVPYKTAYELKHPEVLRVNPKRQVPVLMHGEPRAFRSGNSN
jgi:hypothetical protein